MNIFVTHPDNHECAKALDDKRLNKMILETLQILSTTANVLGFEGPYKTTHVNHPCCVWARESKENFSYLRWHFFWLTQEYVSRFYKKQKTHKCVTVFNDFFDVWAGVGLKIPSGPLTPFVNCTPHKDLPVFEAYRLTLREKWEHDVEVGRPPKWTNTQPPEWR